MEWIIIIVVVAAVFIVRNMWEQRFISEGKMIKRSGDFYQEASEFTLKSIPDEQIAEAIKKIPCSEIGVSKKGDTGRAIFTSSNFEAELVRKSSEPGKMVYQFQFTHWRERRGVLYGVNYMNMLLTSIEKMFLELDPTAKVRTWKLKTSTKVKFF